MKTLYFTSGLPRAGSTLIQNILAQNPIHYATETSGIVDVLFSVRNQWTKQIEHKAHPCPKRMKNVLKSILFGYFEDISQNTVFVKSRGILPYIELMENILEQKIKIIVPVRPVVDILASFEKLYRKTSEFKQPPGEAENYFQFQTIKGRCEYWMRPDQVVGLALNRINDAVARDLKDRMYFVDFNELTSNPRKTFQGIYSFLGEKWFEHNFNHVEQVTQEDDDVHGYIDLHKIKNKVTPMPSFANEILGKEVADHFRKNNL